MKTGNKALKDAVEITILGRKGDIITSKNGVYMTSPLTGNVYLVTKFEILDNGKCVAINKRPVEQDNGQEFETVSIAKEKVTHKNAKPTEPPGPMSRSYSKPGPALGSIFDQGGPASSSVLVGGQGFLSEIDKTIDQTPDNLKRVSAGLKKAEEKFKRKPPDEKRGGFLS